ncbi:coiled-coil domain-containing protein 66 [Lampris incognitus]|uniref:coiled-coil domain-containing protein 66 n=1 Tax=Lampris incognitus TaxID=2546036 RepID=UPI0024B52998|nr:coiled-coil domain-containing protein 66 [Lampris incognitus]
MNLGDGLVFELENGKPRLILLRPGTENPAKISSRPRAAPILSSRQPSSLLVDQKLSEEQPVGPPVGTRREIRRKTGGAPVSSSTFNSSDGRSNSLTSGNPSKIRTNSTTERTAKVRSAKDPDRLKHSPTVLSSLTNGKVGPLPNAEILTNGKPGLKDDTVISAGDRAGVKDDPTNEEAELKDSAVCLTNEKLQQILNTIQTSESHQRPPDHQQTRGKPPLSELDSSVVKKGRETGATGILQDKEKTSDGVDTAGLFSWLTDRHADTKTAMDTKKAQWRKELDDQISMKQQSSASARLQTVESTHSAPSGQGSISHRQQPAAMRSNFKLGEETPAEEAWDAERKEEQRKHWLGELDRQRDEGIQRRRQEKKLHQQIEDHDRWAMHFDSLQRRLPVQAETSFSLPPPPAVGPAMSGGRDNGEWEAGSSLSQRRLPSSSLSLFWDTLSSCGESVDRVSVDTSTRQSTRASYLRSMTALLDPAQLEERERRRAKQLEQQRAIEAQVEERRVQREREEEHRREEEQQEQRRVAMEREAIQRQHQLETHREKERDQLSRRTEEVFRSVQRAQQEALRSKQQQRIKELLRKGHDVTKLLHTMEGGSQFMEEAKSVGSPRKDTAVQTVKGSDSELLLLSNVTDMLSYYQPTPPLLSPPPLVDAEPEPEAAYLTMRTEKENACLTEPGGERGDPYKPFTLTERRETRRPGWNTKRPSRQFIPASQRYPLGLQRSRQESRQRRQAELLSLQERNCSSRSDPAPPPAPPGCLQESHHATKRIPDLDLAHNCTRAMPSRKVENGNQPTVCGERGCAPPVAAVRHRLKSQQHPASSAAPLPPQLEFVPYVRTNEMYLDPISTHTDTRQRSPSSSSSPPPSQREKDPSLQPELLGNTHTHRQQEILRELAQLRQGLLQKRRELETGMNPLLKLHIDGLQSAAATQKM